VEPRDIASGAQTRLSDPTSAKGNQPALTPGKTSRLAYIDWMRGLACILMFQTHCYDAWLSPEARQSGFFMYSQLLGTLPAPLFLFLAGISFALVTRKLIERGITPSEIAKTTIRRGAEIFALGLLFRLQEYLISWGWAPWSDLFRVDILNTIGVSMMLMGVMCWIVLAGGATANVIKRLTLAAGAISLMIAVLTPPLYTTWRPSWLPWPIESYIDGVHNLGVPQAWLFPIFPWTAFAFAGLALGFILQNAWAKDHDNQTVVFTALAGILLIVGARWMDASPFHLYATYDFWHTSPNFYLIRVGMLLMIVFAAFAWCRWGAAAWGFSPLIQLGQTSLLVYWVHLELVYGRVSILRKHAKSIPQATIGLLTICVLMLLLSIARTWLKRRRVESLSPAAASTAN
jgi:uncharacterized membrane protein